MKIADQLHNLFAKKTPTKDVYCSLTLFHKNVSGCIWSIGEDETLSIIHCTHASCGDISWNARIEAADEVVSTLSETYREGEFHNTVLGFAPEFLTADGNIDTSIRSDVKRLTTMLELKPVGFVNIESAMVFQIKHDEGVPPSILLLHVAGEEMKVALYRVGKFIGERTVRISEFIVEDVETAIKSFSDVEILPSRMILYGTTREELESIKSQLLTHQWTTRANFLHYPTIDIFDLDRVAHAVALAGASELTAAFVEEKTEEQEGEREIGEELVAETVVAQENETEKEKEEKTLEELIEEDKKTIEREAEEEIGKEEQEEILEVHPEDANVVPVAPESLGFQKETDILEHPIVPPHPKQPATTGPEEELEEHNPTQGSLKEKLAGVGMAIKKIHLPSFSTNMPILPIGIGVALCLGILAFFAYTIPKATVTISVIPSTVVKTKSVTIAPTAVSLDTAKFIVPGKQLEQSVTAEKTASVSGKKRIGTPAKGTVTIYNKATALRTLKKGTVLTSNALQFSLDSDVEIASASESIGSITFGKATAGITAIGIGEEGNLPSGSEFTVKDISSGVVSARNDQAFSGGTSREATVVTRADYDALVKTVSDELVAKAKADLLAGVAGNEKLIDQTVKTTVTSKTFKEELDQETNELHGKVTLTISGIVYSEDDMKSILMPLATPEVPGGYVANEGRTTVEVTTPSVKKDGTIVVQATISLVSLPSVDGTALTKQLMGKTIDQAQDIIKKIQGVGSVEIFFSHALTKRRLPMSAKNIEVAVVVSQ